MRPHLFLLADDARVGTGIDDIVESLFADVIFRPDVTAQDFAVAKAAACMLVINTHDVLHTKGITAPDYFSPILLHRLE
nr:MAG TPA: hypothetical protein [Caudoviricetes sp.]